VSAGRAEIIPPVAHGEALSTNVSDERLNRAFTAFLRQELQAPATAVSDLLDIIIEDANRRALNHALPDLERMRTASIRLNAFVKDLAEGTASVRQQGEPVEEFYRRVRHDLRTPLNAIKGYSELLIEDLEADGHNHLRDDLATLKESADKLLGQIDSMVAAPRPEETPDHDGRQQQLVADFLRTLRPVDAGDSSEPSVHASRVLVVDDNAYNRDILARRLSREGHQVITATNGPAALELVTAQEFDLVLLDLVMPEMSGFEVLRRLKAAEHTSRVPVIVISALDELDSVVRCIEAGAEDYLPKPFNPILLRARIGACLEKKWLRDREKQFIMDLEEALRRDVAKRRLVEEALHASETQRFLIETERLAALGGLVAGVAHEISGPVGVSLTVASTLANRSANFAEQIAAGPVRRSQLAEFTDCCRDAASQLVANLQRAGELVQSFKQVAVDRSHAERRAFDLKPATDQIVASLRPGLRKSQSSIAVEMPSDIIMDSYPGAYGQVLTNLVFNAVTHGFDDTSGGHMLIDARRLDMERVEITFSDDGRGMSEEVQRHVFDPFFTTRRAQGSTGLGLHIVYNIVTQRLGGRITLVSAPGRGATFRMTLPLLAPGEESQPTATRFTT